MTTQTFPPSAVASVQNLVRWLGLGLTPSERNTTAALELVGPLRQSNPAAHEKISHVLSEARRGVLPSQALCLEADACLKQLRAAAAADDVPIETQKH